MEEEQGYYVLLGVEEDATMRQIKLAYRKKIRKYHPDVNKAKDAEKIAKLINQAYAILSDPVKREEYDLQINAYTSPTRDYTKTYTVPDEVWEDISNIYKEAQNQQQDIRTKGKQWTPPSSNSKKSKVRKVRVQTEDGYYDIEWH